jgi:hypothetical protein
MHLAIHEDLEAYFASLPRAAQHMIAKPNTITSHSAIPSTTHLLYPKGLRMTFGVIVTGSAANQSITN